MSAVTYRTLLNTTPTGFGGYTGIVLTNSGNYPIKYTLSMSDTTFEVGTVSTATALNADLYNTIFVATDLDNVSTDVSSYSQIVNTSDSGVFYVVNKPFSTFKNLASRSTGLEYATLNIKSESSFGDLGDDINIYITGQRITGCPIPERFGKFYAIKGYNRDDGVNLDCHFSSINNLDYFTGYNIDLATDVSFASVVSSVSKIISANDDPDLPIYGKYHGLSGYEYSNKFTNLNFSTNYYARVQAVNATGGTGAYSYATGFIDKNFVIDDITYSGLHPAPGDNLKVLPTGLYLTYRSDSETDFDIYNFLINSNEGSVDFRYYTGVNIKFYPKTENTVASFIASDISKGAVNFVYNTKAPILFNANPSDNVFRLELEFENVSLFGKGGYGASPTTSATVGGPIFNLDNVLDTSNPSAIKKIQYYIYKDLDSKFYAGPGGGQSVVITDKNKVSITLDGPQVNNLTHKDFKTPNLKGTN
jgi:hypothetical protein